MITFRKRLFDEWTGRLRADQKCDCSLGNMMFFIAGTIGIALKNGYSFGFPKWNNNEFFVNELPEREQQDYTRLDIDWGFNGFDIPDGVSLFGWLQSEKYFEHCEGVIRYYLTPKRLIIPIKDTILIHYRAYPGSLSNIFILLQKDYYRAALAELPDKRVLVITDNVTQAKTVLGDDYEYVSNTPIEDFVLLANADYLVMSNSSFSWWGAYLSKAKTVAPNQWFNPSLGQDQKDMYCKDWIRI